jgi:hypothetical protein
MANQTDPEVIVSESLSRENLSPLHPDFAIDKGTDCFRRRVQGIWSKLEVEIKDLSETVIGYENLHYETDRIKARIFRTEVTDLLKELRECMDGAPQDLVEGSNCWIVVGERELEQVGTKLDDMAMPTFVVSVRDTNGTNNPTMTGYWEADVGDRDGVGNNLNGEEDDQSIDASIYIK